MFKLYTSQLWNRKFNFYPLRVSLIEKTINISYFRFAKIGMIDISLFSDFGHFFKSNPSEILLYKDIIKTIKHEKLLILVGKNIKISEPPKSSRKWSIRESDLFYHNVGESYLNIKSHKKKSKDLERLTKKIPDLFFSTLKIQEIDEIHWNKILVVLHDNKINIGVSTKKVKKLIKFLNYLKTKNHFNDADIIIDTMYIEDNIAAVHIGIQYGDYYLYWLPAYSNKYKQFSPGLQLLSYILDNADNRNIKHIDFGNGNEAYKKWFATGKCISYTGVLW